MEAMIKTEKEYQTLLMRLEELLRANTNEEDPVHLAELEILGNLIADYEDIHYPFPPK